MSIFLAPIVPLLQAAVDALAAFRGDAKAASTDAKIADAAEILSAIAPLVDGFAAGAEITPEDVRDALAGMDQALAEFDAEIAKQTP